MGEKKILLISNGFYPEISPRSFRATELAKEFTRQGHKVVVFSKYRKFDYSGFLKENAFNLKMWGRDRFHRVPEWNGKISGIITRMFSRIWLQLFEYPGIEDTFKVRRVLKLENGYDLMISFAVPHPVHWGVAWARSVKHPIARTWVADCGDPYMLDTNDSFKKLFYFQFLEKWFSRKADYITIPREEMKKYYYEEFHNKIRIIPQGFNFDDVKLSKTLPVNKVPTFAFAGTFIRTTRDPRPFLDYLCQVKDDFKFIIYTKNKDLLLQYNTLLGNKVEIRDYIPRNDLLLILSQMDFLVNIGYDPASQSPSKLIDYALTGRPVLNIDKDFSKQTVEEFLNGNYSKKMIVGEIKQYDIKNISRMFLDLTSVIK